MAITAAAVSQSRTNIEPRSRRLTASNTTSADTTSTNSATVLATASRRLWERSPTGTSRGLRWPATTRCQPATADTA